MSTPSCFGHLPFGSDAKLNVAFIVATVYIVCYVVMEPVVGSIGGLLVAAIYLYSGHLVNKKPNGSSCDIRFRYRNHFILSS